MSLGPEAFCGPGKPLLWPAALPRLASPMFRMAGVTVVLCHNTHQWCHATMDGVVHVTLVETRTWLSSWCTARKV